MRRCNGTVAVLTVALLSAAAGLHAQATQPDGSAATGSGAGPSTRQGTGQNAGQGERRGGGMRGMGGAMGMPGGGRGVFGTVTEVTGEHYSVKTDTGDIYTVHFSANTRIMKQPPGQGRPRSDDGERMQPQPLKASEIKVGDAITAGGELDTAGKSLGAVLILQLDPARAKELRAMEANYGKTWLAGRITAIDGTTVTIEGVMDHTAHAIAVDENTSFRKRRDAITLADIKPGDQLRAEGAMKDGVFLATVVNAMNPAERPGGEGRPGGQGNVPALTPPQ